MSIIGLNRLSHEIKGHLRNLWPELPVPFLKTISTHITNKKETKKHSSGDMYFSKTTQAKNLAVNVLFWQVLLYLGQFYT